MMLNGEIAQGWDFGTWQLATPVRISKSKLYPVICFIQNPWTIDWFRLIYIHTYIYIYIYPLIDRKKILYIRRSVLAFWAFWILQKWHINLLHCPIQTKGGLQCWPSLLSRCMITSLQNFHMVTNILVISQVKVLLANAAKAGNNKH